MKRIEKSVLIIIFILLIGVTFNVKAESFNYYLSDNDSNYEYVDKNSVKAKTVKRGDTIKVTAIIDNKDNVSDYRINSGKLTVRWDEKYLSLDEVDGKYYNDSITDISELSLGSVHKSSNKFSIEEISSNGLLKSGKNKIVEYKFHVLDNAPSGEAKIYQMDGEDNLKCFFTTEERTVNCGESLYSEIRINIEKSNVNKISSIKINGKELPNFNEDTNDYELTVESNVEKVNIAVVKKDEKSAISGNYGDNPVKYGSNKFTINIISESGIKNTYTFNIIREDSRSTVNTLKTLTLSAGEIEFKPNVTDYNVTVENDVEKLIITSSLTDPKSKYVEDYTNKVIELNEGSNKVEIKVISEKGEEKVYTLNINRSLSSNNSLKSLKVNDEKVELKKDEFIYNLILENEITDVVIKAETNDPKATVELDERYPLQVGDNEIVITVVAASGSKATYTLNITRKKMLSKDSLLTSIKIEGYSIDFKPTTTLYNLKIDDKVDELKITTTQQDPNATVVIEGNKDLENGSIIKINVRAEDGSYTRYFINIEKGSSGISPIVIVIIVLLILLAGCIGLIFYRKKRKEKKEFDKFDKEAKEEKKEKKEEPVETDESKEEPTKEEKPEQEENYVETELPKEATVVSETELNSDEVEEQNDVSEEKEEQSEVESDEDEDPNYVGSHVSSESVEEEENQDNEEPAENNEEVITKSELNYQDEEYEQPTKKVLSLDEEEVQNKDVE